MSASGEVIAGLGAGRMVRERYRKASELSRVRGKLSCLIINDIDAGLGHFGNTQITVSSCHLLLKHHHGAQIGNIRSAP